MKGRFIMYIIAVMLLLSGKIAGQDEDESRILSKMSTLSSEKKYIEAADLLEEYEHIFRTVNGRHLRFAQLSYYYLFSRKFDKAADAAREALALDNTDVMPKTNLAHALLFLGKTQEAQKVYGDICNTYYRVEKPFEQALLDDFDELEQANAIPDESKDAVEKFRLLFRNDVLVRVDAMIKEERWTEAKEFLKTNIQTIDKKSFKYGLALYRLGTIYYYYSEKEKAKDYFSKSIAYFSALSLEKVQTYHAVLYRSYDYLYSIYLKDNNFNDAINSMNEIINHRYYNAYSDSISLLSKSYGKIAYCYLFNKQFVIAEEYAHKGFSVDSTSNIAKVNLAHALLLQEKYDEADALYHQLWNKEYDSSTLYSQYIYSIFEEMEKQEVFPDKQKSEIEKRKQHAMEETVSKAKRLYESNNYRLASLTLQLSLPNIPKTNKLYPTVIEYIGKGYAMDIDTTAISYLEEWKRIVEENAVNDMNKKISTEPVQWLGNFYNSVKNYGKAAIYREKELMIYEKQKMQDSKNYEKLLDELWYYFWESNNYKKSIEYYTQNINYKRNNTGKNDDDYIRSLNVLAGMYLMTEDFTNAEKRYLEVLHILENVTDRNNLLYIKSLGNLGTFYYHTGNYENAEKYYLEAANIQKNTGYDVNSSQILNNLASIYYAMGDLRNAEKYYLTILPVYQDLIRNKDISERNVAYARLLNNLGILYNEMGNYSESEKYFLEALKCKQEVFGGDHSEYAATLNNLGAIYRNIKDYPKAEKYYQDALNIIENKYGKNHSGYAISINNLGSLYTNMGNYEKAEKYLSEANDICMNVLGESHPNTSISISNMAVLYQSLDNHDKTVLFKAKACGIKQNSIEKNFTFLSENQRNLYWNKATSEFESSYSVSWIYPNKESNILNYNNTLFTKGLLLRTNNGIRDAIYVSGNSQLIGQYEQLGNLRKEISILQQKPDFNKEYAQTLEARADSLDKAVTQASAAFRDLKADIAMTWQDVQKQLKKDEAAIEFVHFRLYDKHWTDTTMYAALVLRHGMTAPAWIPLCEQKQLQSALQTESKDVQQQTEMQYIEKGKELYRQAWSPLDKELAGVKTVYYSPSGLLHKIAFNALPTDKPTILLSDKYNLKLVSSTREIARLKKETAGKPAQDTTVVYGGLTYDMNQASMLASARKYRQEDSLLSDNSSRRIDRIRRRRDAELPDSTLRSGFSSWQYLKGTKSETEEIVSSLEQKNIPHEYLTETRGNEESFKHLSGTKTGVIHLATHGFFLPDIENKAVENIVQLLGGNKEKPFENPLLRSGLIMSGANNQWAAKESVMEDGIEDGILTADEIARLNLTRTELVVLSACETGLGDVKNSEGVFGLQRAFKLAGVKSLIMSLWKVPDEATAELMTAFYHGWLNGKTKQEAFKTAQMQVREKYKSPYYWAAFVMMD